MNVSKNVSKNAIGNASKRVKNVSSHCALIKFTPKAFINNYSKHIKILTKFEKISISG